MEPQLSNESLKIQKIILSKAKQISELLKNAIRGGGSLAELSNLIKWDPFDLTVC